MRDLKKSQPAEERENTNLIDRSPNLDEHKFNN